jgi:hypothetical protein
MAWEIKDKALGIFVVAPTELQAWIMFFGVQGKEFDGENFFKAVRFVGRVGLRAIEVR